MRLLQSIGREYVPYIYTLHSVRSHVVYNTVDWALAHKSQCFCDYHGSRRMCKIESSMDVDR